MDFQVRQQTLVVERSPDKSLVSPNARNKFL